MISQIKAKVIQYWLKKKNYTLLKNNVIIENGYAYNSGLYPYAKYSPWITDRDFNDIFLLVKDYTLITEPQRMYELWQLAMEVKDLEGDYIEVGSWRGGSGALIASVAMKHSSLSNVYLCDTFEGVVKAGEKDNFYKNGEHKDTNIDLVLNIISELKLTNTSVLKGIFPDETGHNIEGNKFKFCHIDVDVYESARAITEWVWERLVIGGVVIFDDFGFRNTQGVTSFVESQRNKSDRLVIHNLNGHGIIIKIA